MSRLRVITATLGGGLVGLGGSLMGFGYVQGGIFLAAGAFLLWVNLLIITVIDSKTHLEINHKR